MSAYINIFTLEYPKHEGDIRLEYPEISENLTGDEFPCPENYALVKWVDRPFFDVLSQRCSEGVPELINGIWYMTWVVRDAT